MDFVQTMKDWRRMCLSYKSCDDCPMMDADGWAHILCSEGGIQSAVPEIQEAVIEKWATENPEPVYPTWGEWLHSQKVVGVHAMQAPSQNVYYPVEGKMNTSIPADIAQKLGIEPKEG